MSDNTFNRFIAEHRVDCKVSIQGHAIYLDFSINTNGRSLCCSVQVKDEDIRSCKSFPEFIEKLLYKENYAIWEMYKQSISN